MNTGSSVVFWLCLAGSTSDAAASVRQRLRDTTRKPNRRRKTAAPDVKEFSFVFRRCGVSAWTQQPYHP